MMDMIKKFLFFFAFIFYLIFSLTYCSAEEDPKQKETDAMKNSQDKFVDPLDMEKLKKSAKAFTFEDIKSMNLQEMKDVIWPGGVIWFKDFYNWELDQLTNEKTEFIMLEIADSKYYSNEDVNEAVIDGEKILTYLSFQQIQSLDIDLLKTFCQLRQIEMSIYSPESIKQLNNEQLEAVAVWLTVEQVLALDNNQIFYANIGLNPEAVKALSVERLKSLGDDIFRLPIGLLTYEQFQVLDMDKILRSDKEQYLRFSRKNLSPEQFSWLTVEQIPLLNTKYNFSTIRYGLFKHLSAEQLKAFTSEQLEAIEPISGIKLFSMDQVRFLVDYGTANSNMRTVIKLIDAGPDVFKGAERGLITHNFLPKELGDFLNFLEPEQFKYIKKKQLVYALLITAYLPNLSPEQIYNMPYFVESLQVDTVLENETVFVESDHQLQQYLMDQYGTLNIISLLDENQIRAIHPGQIPVLNESQLSTIVRNKRNNRGLFVFTPEQFNSLTLEQFDYMLELESYSERFISEEQFEALSVAHIDVLLENFIPLEMKQALIERRGHLLKFGDIKLKAKDMPPKRIPMDVYQVAYNNQLRYSRSNSSIYNRYKGICVARYKEEKAKIVEPDIVQFEAMDGLDICIAGNLKYAEEHWDRSILFDGCVHNIFDMLPDKFKEICYQDSCLNSVIENKIIAFKNYEKCLKEYHPELY